MSATLPFKSCLDPDLFEDGSTVAARYGDIQLRTHFQPIYSLSHRRVVGHEALLRGRDAFGVPISPPEIFATCKSPDELRRLDWLAGLTHCTNFSRARRLEEWLFLNMHPQTFSAPDVHDPHVFESLFLDHCGVPANQVVIEVLEHAIDRERCLETEIARLRDMGCLIALDDFGAGHSNFDRVWSLRPDIVKLDRSVIVRAASNRAVRRVTAQMVSMLHECGSLVLMEGIENEDEAHIALDSDVDFVQGYFFGKPQPTLVGSHEPSASLESAWELFDERWMADRNQYRTRISPYRKAIAQAAAKLAAGSAAADACQAFLSLAGAQTCYLLDADGFQVGGNLSSHAPTESQPRSRRLRASPLTDTRNARWSRRPYFRRALNAPGTVQVTRPYLTMTTLRTCVTVSIGVECGGRTLIVCGDIFWDDEHAVPRVAEIAHAQATLPGLL